MADAFCGEDEKELSFLASRTHTNDDDDMQHQHMHVSMTLLLLPNWVSVYTAAVCSCSSIIITDRLTFDLATISMYFVLQCAGPDRQPLLHLRPCLRQHRHALGGHVRRVRGAAGRRPLPGLQRYRARVRPGPYPSTVSIFIFFFDHQSTTHALGRSSPPLNHLARIPCAIDAAKELKSLDHRVGA